MSTPLEDYALLSDLHTAALVSREGSIDWLCFPRFDSQAVFAALVGGTKDGHWNMSVVDGEVESRRYLEDSFVLETTWRGPTGRLVVTDYMPVHGGKRRDVADLVRHVRCIEGTAILRHLLCLRFDYYEDERVGSWASSAWWLTVFDTGPPRGCLQRDMSIRQWQWSRNLLVIICLVRQM